MGTRLIHHLSESGLTIRAEGDALIVEPRNLITDPLRQFIRENKAGIIAELITENNVYQPIEPVLDPPAAQPVFCLTCQHYRFGHDHMGNVARCMASGGFRGALIERPEQRRECGDYVLYDDPNKP